LIFLGACRKGGSCRENLRKTGAKLETPTRIDPGSRRIGSATIDRPAPSGARQKTPWTVRDALGVIDIFHLISIS
jgi:hypothetical protein